MPSQKMSNCPDNTWGLIKNARPLNSAGHKIVFFCLIEVGNFIFVLNYLGKRIVE